MNDNLNINMINCSRPTSFSFDLAAPWRQLLGGFIYDFFRCFNQDGVQVVSDEISLGFIKGSTVDYEEELIRSAFCVKSNPQSSTKCSCGVSFSID